MKNIKKTLALALILTTASMATVQNNANALVGLLIANAPLAIAGAVVAAGAGGIELCAYECGNESESDRQLDGVFALIMTAPAGAVGLLLLDGDAAQTVVYKAIDANEAQKLSLSSDQVDSYNSHLSEINLVLQSVESDLAQVKSPTVADSRAAWGKYSSALPTPAMEAVVKISQQALAK